MRLRLGLRARFVAALLSVAVLLSAGYYYSVHRIVELVEIELQQRALDRELEEFADQLARSPGSELPQRLRMRAYVVHDERELESLPERLRDLRPGQHRELMIDGHRYQAARRDVGSLRLILAHDIEDIEALERRLVALAWFIVGAGLLVAAAVGVLLARAVTRPVSRLAALVTGLDPTRRGQRVDDPADDPEIGRIAVAFDRFLVRLDEYVSREQAFTDEASHELRTPLAIVDSATQLLKRQNAHDASTQQRLARIERATAQMHSLIEALLFLARADGGLAQEPVALDTLLQEVCDGHRELLGGRDLSLSCEVTAPQTVQAPRGMVLCVLNNLLGNAIRHTAQGRIEVCLQPGCIRIRDTGSGIPDEDLPHIFELGYRGRQSRGSGLGLHLVRRICDRLGWRIDVQSAAGTGTEFRVSLDAAA